MSPFSEASRASRPATQQSGRPQTQQSSSATGTGAAGSRPQTQQSQRPGTTQSMAAMTNVAAAGKLKSLDITWICLRWFVICFFCHDKWYGHFCFAKYKQIEDLLYLYLLLGWRLDVFLLVHLMQDSLENLDGATMSSTWKDRLTKSTPHGWFPYYWLDIEQDVSMSIIIFLHCLFVTPWNSSLFQPFPTKTKAPPTSPNTRHGWNMGTLGFWVEPPATRIVIHDHHFTKVNNHTSNLWISFHTHFSPVCRRREHT